MREAEMVRHEEQLRLTRTWRPAALVRVRRRIVTEERTVTVQVRREELIVETVPLEDGRLEGGAAGADVRPADHPAEGYAFDLFEEEIELHTRPVPRERVRVFVDRVSQPHEVQAVLGREQVEVQEAVPPTA